MTRCLAFLTVLLVTVNGSSGFALNHHAGTPLLYDSQDRVSTRQHYATSNASTPAASITYSYDANDNLLTTTEGSAVLTRSYDAHNRVISYTNARAETLLYRYDANGNLTRLTLPDGKTLDYTYDSRDHLSTVTDWAARTTTLSWDAASRLTQVTRPNGTTRKLFYDSAARLQRLEERKADGHLIELVRLGYDPGGRVTRRFVVPLPAATSFAARSASYTADNWISGSTYDGDGNLGTVPALPVGVPASPFAPSIPQASPGIKVFAGGSVTNATWDQRNRLTTLILNTGTATYTYDAEDLRITKTLSGGGPTTRYTQNPHGLSGMSEVVLETDAASGARRWYVWGGPAGLLYDVSSTTGSVRYYHADQVGSTLALSDESGSVIGRLDYTPYGLIIRREGSTTTPFLFNGALGVMRDEETGLIHMRARYYHPWMGRFLNEDPIGLDGGMNTYAFTGGNPISYFDAMGLDRAGINWGSVAQTAARFYVAPVMPLLSAYEDYRTYQANYQATGSHYTAANATANPVYSVMAKTAEANEGIGLQAHQMGQTLGTGQRAWSGTQAALETVGMVSGIRGAVAGASRAARGAGGVLSNADNAFNRMLQAGQAADKNGLTKAGRALQKHGARAGSVFPPSTGNAAARNAQGQGVLDEILRAQTQTIKPNRFGGRDIFDAGTGRGVRYDGNSNMMGFLEP